MRRNSYLFDELVVSSYSAENQRQFSILGMKEVHQRSSILSSSVREGDISYDDKNKLVLDAIDIDGQGSRVTIGHCKIASQLSKAQRNALKSAP